MNAIEEFILAAEAEEREILMYLHQLLTERMALKPKLRYRIPFYDHNTWLCYLNPLRKGGVELVFLNAQQLTDPSGILDARGRKMVAGVRINSLAEIPEHDIVALVEEAKSHNL